MARTRGFVLCGLVLALAGLFDGCANMAAPQPRMLGAAVGAAAQAPDGPTPNRTTLDRATLDPQGT